MTQPDVKVPITRPAFGPEEMEAVQRPVESGWVIQGPYVKQFEETFAEFTGARYSTATSSCTTALHIAVAALKLKPGDEVIVPAFTWVSTPNVVEYMGATPVFCDIDRQTFNIDTEQIEGLITPRTVGIVPVHLFGLCADMQPILDIASKHGLWVVEDAACGFGARYWGDHAGTLGDAGCFSFHPRKAITTGEGGMIVTDKPELDRQARILRDHGASRSELERHRAKDSSWLSEYDHLGYNYRMTDIQGSLGCAQMQRAEWVLRERSRRAHLYDEALAEMEWFEPPVTPDGYVHGYQAYVCLFRSRETTLDDTDRISRQRNELMDRLTQRGIATRQGTHAPVILGYYVDKYGLRREQFPSAYMADRLTITLPLFPQITDDEQALVVSEIGRSMAGLDLV